MTFPESCTGPVLLSVASILQKSMSLHCNYITIHYFVKLGWDLVWAFLVLLTEILYYIYILFLSLFLFFFFFYKLSFNFFFFSFSSFCPRLKFSLDSLNWEKKKKQNKHCCFLLKVIQAPGARSWLMLCFEAIVI